MKKFPTIFTAAILSIWSASSALSHATLEAKHASINSYQKSVVRIGHGCDGEATLIVRVTIPEGVINAKPMPKAGWEIVTVVDEYEEIYKLHGKEIKSGVKKIVWLGSLANDRFDEFAFQARFTDHLEVGKKLYIPVEQVCASGSRNWNDIPAADQNPHELKSPAPGLMIMDKKSSH